MSPMAAHVTVAASGSHYPAQRAAAAVAAGRVRFAVRRASTARRQLDVRGFALCTQFNFYAF